MLKIEVSKLNSCKYCLQNMSYIKGKVFYIKALPFILWIKLVILNIIVGKSNLLNKKANHFIYHKYKKGFLKKYTF